ncbi:PLASTID TRANSCRIPTIONALLY ACTIVE protein 6, chloroplastic-like [Brassica napus]|uniref:PLASTID TRANSCRIPTIONALLY ACTIVE protein 6, chloroplastic-like n=1 Tax=Brassica napus TaxID=3708 RepID=UPI002078ED98|nr:PLASTID TRANSCRIPTIONALLY ACTIVE protein 6, chloroplastic-like [Brassica napus]
MVSSVISRSLSLLLFTSKPSPSPSAAAATTHLLFPSLRTNACFAPPTLNPRRRGRSIIVRVDEADDRGGQDEYDMVNEEVEELDNKKDYDVEYDPMAAASGGGYGDIAFVQIKSFTSTQGWNSEMVVDYRINEDGFHKISL